MASCNGLWHALKDGHQSIVGSHVVLATSPETDDRGGENKADQDSADRDHGPPPAYSTGTPVVSGCRSETQFDRFEFGGCAVGLERRFNVGGEAYRRVAFARTGLACCANNYRNPFAGSLG